MRSSSRSGSLFVSSEGETSRVEQICIRGCAEQSEAVWTGILWQRSLNEVDLACLVGVGNGMWCGGPGEATNEDLGEGASLEDGLLALWEMRNDVELVGCRGDFGCWNRGWCGVEERPIEPGYVAILEPVGSLGSSGSSDSLCS